MKKVIFMLLISILTLNSCSMLSYTISEIKNTDWKKGWWWNQDYPKGDPIKIISCDKKGNCVEKYRD